MTLMLRLCRWPLDEVVGAGVAGVRARLRADLHRQFQDCDGVGSHGRRHHDWQQLQKRECCIAGEFRKVKLGVQKALLSFCRQWFLLLLNRIVDVAGVLSVLSVAHT